MSNSELILAAFVAAVVIFALIIYRLGTRERCSWCFEPWHDCHCEDGTAPCFHAYGPWKHDDTGHYRVCKFCTERQDAES